MSTSFIVAQILLISPPSLNMMTFAFRCMFCTPSCPIWICFYTNLTIMSAFMKKKSNTCPFLISTLNTTTLLPVLSPSLVEMNSTLIIVVVFDILTCEVTEYQLKITNVKIRLNCTKISLRFWDCSATLIQMQHLQNTLYTIYDNIVLRIWKQWPVTYKSFSHRFDQSWDDWCTCQQVFFLVVFLSSVSADVKVYIASVFSSKSGSSFSLLSSLSFQARSSRCWLLQHYHSLHRELILYCNFVPQDKLAGSIIESTNAPSRGIFFLSYTLTCLNYSSPTLGAKILSHFFTVFN